MDSHAILYRIHMLSLNLKEFKKKSQVFSEELTWN